MLVSKKAVYPSKLFKAGHAIGEKKITYTKQIGGKCETFPCLYLE